MAEKKKVEPMVMLNPKQTAARMLAEEIEEQKADGIQIDKTIPGGKFLGTDGKLHNAEGKLIDEDGNLVKESKKAAAQPAEE